MGQKNSLPNIWRPFGRIPSLFDEAEEWFPDLMSFSDERGLSISENNNSIIVEASVPGLKSDDIEISLNKGVLWIKGKKIEEEDDKNRKYYRRASNSYSYCTSLPENINMDAEPEAVCKDGIVKITFTKKAASEAKKIKIKK